MKQRQTVWDLIGARIVFDRPPSAEPGATVWDRVGARLVFGERHQDEQDHAKEQEDP